MIGLLCVISVGTDNAFSQLLKIEEKVNLELTCQKKLLSLING